jgi:hypothetical protein
MYAVNALYDGAGNVKIDPAAVSINTPYKVIVTFVEPAQGQDGSNTASNAQKKMAALVELERFGKRLPVDFDYKKERDAYYEERYENYLRSR